MKRQDKKHLFDKFCQKISQIKERFESIGVTSQALSTLEFRQVVIDMKKLLMESDFLPIFDKIQKDKKLAKVAEELRDIYFQYYIYQESKAALGIILDKSKNPFISNNSMLAEREAEFSNINKKSHVFFIGSGPFPWTAINYATPRRCRVTCIENNPAAVSLSAELIKKLSLDSLISVFCANAQKFDYDQATHVTIAGMVNPKTIILKQINDTSRRDVKIIARSSFDLYFFMYERITRDMLKDFKIINVVTAGKNSELVSYILVKKIL